MFRAIRGYSFKSTIIFRLLPESDLQPEDLFDITYECVKFAFKFLEWDFVDEKKDKWISGRPSRWLQLYLNPNIVFSTKETMRNKLWRTLAPASYNANFDNSLPDHITWNFGLCSSDLSANLDIYIAKSKLSKLEAKEKLDSVTKQMLNTLFRITQNNNINMQVLPFQEK